MSLAEKMARWGTTCESSPPSGALDPSNFAHSEDSDNDDLDAAFLLGYSDLRSFLLDSAEYAWLLRNLNISLQSDVDDTSRMRIRRMILSSLDACVRQPTGRYRINIEVPWQPRCFLHQQYGHLPIHALLGSVITLSGSEQNAYAATCQDYVQWLWPRVGSQFIHLIQAAADSPDTIVYSREETLDLELQMSNRWTISTITGDPLSLLDAAEAFIWLSMACRPSTGKRTQICRLDLDRILVEVAGVMILTQLSFDDIPLSESSPASCWHEMFRNPVVVEGFPIPPRTVEERGLEISIELMLSLAQTFWATVYNGALVLKGFATLLTPTLKVGESVIWHLTADTEGKRLSYNRGFDNSILKNLDGALFPGARHFVGWLKSADYLVGEF